MEAEGVASVRVDGLIVVVARGAVGEVHDGRECYGLSEPPSLPPGAPFVPFASLAFAFASAEGFLACLSGFALSCLSGFSSFVSFSTSGTLRLSSMTMRSGAAASGSGAAACASASALSSDGSARPPSHCRRSRRRRDGSRWRRPGRGPSRPRASG